MSNDAISRNSPATFTATTATVQTREGSALKRAELQADQAEALSKRRQAELAVPQAVINAQGQPTGTLINIIA